MTNQLGIFSYEPQYLLQGLLLSEAARASPTNRNWRHPLGNTHYHAKLDNSGFNFANRSHGVGYSVGLVDNFTSDALAYSYEEIGLSPQVYCIYNSSSNLVFSNMLDTGLGNPDVALWQVGGTLPNAVSVAGLATEVDAEPPVFIASGTRNTSYVSFAVGVPNPGVKSFYDALNQTQCQIEMRPTLFTVSVDLTNNTITVIPVQGRDPPHEPASASLLFSKVVSTLGAISYITATSLGTSPFGNAFINNIFQSGATDPQQRRQAITDSLTNMLDNTLLIINSAQLLLMPNNVAVPVNVSRPALQFGTPVYIYLVVASQVVVWLIYVGELIRTRFWHGVTEFDFLDPTKILLAASGGGLAVAEAAQQKRLQTRPHVRKDEESDIDRIKVRLEHEVDGKVDGPILVLDGTPLPQHRRTESTKREDHERLEAQTTESTKTEDRERLEAQTNESVPGDQPSQSDEGAPRIDVNIPLQRMRSMLTISPSSPLRPSYQRLGRGVEEHGA